MSRMTSTDTSQPLQPTTSQALRTEIVEAEKTGADFLKWKLIGTATVASIALSMSSPTSPAAPDALLMLCLIPLICAYVDMVSLDLVIRIIVIAAFLRDKEDPYELFVQRLRGSDENPFSFAPTAIHLSSITVNLLIIAVGIFGTTRSWPRLHVTTFLVAGILGSIISSVLWIVHSMRVRHITLQVKNSRSA